MVASRSTGRIREVERDLLAVFRRSKTKYEANDLAKPILEQVSRDPSFITAVLEQYVATAGSLDKKNYPVVSIKLALNPHFSLVANCWIPLASRETNLSTKAIHHHGDLLLSTATIFGPGYEHWMFSLPQPHEKAGDKFSMRLLESAAHPRHHVSFVDAWTAHTPFYPPALSITLALWTSRSRVTWRDHLKRLPVFRGREDQLRKLALRLGVGAKRLDLKVVDSFDYFPVEQGFEVMKERKEFALGPNADHVASVFHILQETGNEHLSKAVRRAVAEGRVTAGRSAVDANLALLEQGKKIEGRLSPGHTDLPYANFTREDIHRALGNSSTKTDEGSDHGRQFSPATPRETPAGTGAH